MLTVPARLGRAAGESRLIVPGRATSTARPNPVLIKALARAHAALEQLRAGSLEAGAHHLARTLPIACLAPDITEAILDGTQPEGLTLDQLRKPLPLAWTEQRRRLGFPAAASRDDDAVSHEPERRRRAGRPETTTEPSPCP